VILTTTPFLQGSNVAEYLGIVSGEAALRLSMDQAVAAIGQAFTGDRRFAHIEEALRTARESATALLAERATAMGANAVVGIQTDCETIEGAFVSVVTGTAVRLG